MDSFYCRIDKATSIGIRIALMLWPPNWFMDHFIPPIKLTKTSTRKSVTTITSDRVRISLGEQKIFAGTI